MSDPDRRLARELAAHVRRTWTGLVGHPDYYAGVGEWLRYGWLGDPRRKWRVRK